MEDSADTPRIGFDRIIRTMATLFGDENAMICHMWSHYFKYWYWKHLNVASPLQNLFQTVWLDVNDRDLQDSQPVIATTYYYAYAAYCLRDEKSLGIYRWLGSLFRLSLAVVVQKRFDPLLWTYASRLRETQSLTEI